MMDLRRYPLDEQNCTLEIESCKFTLYIAVLFSFLEIYKWHCESLTLLLVEKPHGLLNCLL